MASTTSTMQTDEVSLQAIEASPHAVEASPHAVEASPHGVEASPHEDKVPSVDPYIFSLVNRNVRG